MLLSLLGSPPTLLPFGSAPEHPHTVPLPIRCDHTGEPAGSTGTQQRGQWWQRRTAHLRGFVVGISTL